MSRYKLADLTKVKKTSLKKRRSLVGVESFGKPHNAKGARDFFKRLPGFLQASDLNEFLTRAATARKKKFPFHIMMGAHVIKVGLSPILIDLMKSKILTGLSLNSAGLIHDLEVAFTGGTSEDVTVGLKDGTFGMSRQTGEMFTEVAALATERSIGLGEAAGLYINEKKAKYRKYSLFAHANTLGLPVTVHTAVGTDIVCQHDTYNPSNVAESSFKDFRILANLLMDVDRGGVVVNLGSAVILPEVFLKALTVARNLKKQKCNITTANFDMINQYRPITNVVKRPTEKGGEGFNFVGHHEIMIPLLAWGLKAYIGRTK
jgi:hypothetical protein